MAPTTLIAILLYLLTVIILWVNTKYNKKQFNFYSISLWIIAIIMHAIVIQTSLLVDNGIDLSFFKSFSLSMLLLSITLLLVCLSQPLMTLGFIIFPLTILAIILQQLDTTNQHIIITSSGIKIHIISSLLAYAFLNLAFIQTIAIYIQDWKLKHSSLLGYLSKLPPLTAMENFLFILLGIGVLLLSIGLTTGLLYHEDLFAQHLIHKTVLSIMAWIFFVSVLAGHVMLGWRGKVIWKVIFSGFILLLLAYFGSKFVLELVLHRT